MTKKYETLNGDPIETDHSDWLELPNGLTVGPSTLKALAEAGIIRRSKLTPQELLDRTPSLPYYPSVFSPDSALAGILKRIIDLDLTDQFLDND